MTVTDSPPARIASSVKPSGKGGKSGKGAKGDGSGEGGKKRSGKLKIIIVVVLLLAGGAAAKFTVLAPKAAAKGPVKPVPGPVIAMDELTLNLDSGHFLRLKLSLQTTKGTSSDLDVTEGTQAVIDEFSNRPVAALTGGPARDKARADLLTKLQKIYPKQIMGVYYTEFVMQ
jgi:flagellar FliL protein